MTATDSLAYLTPDLPGIGGMLKQRPEDFLVEEQPLYQPCGEGEHVYLYIEKRGLTTMDAVQRIARAMHMHRRNIGHAGLKDKHAVTRQHLSLWLPGVDDATIAQGVERINTYQPNIRVLWTDRHTNKLRRGHHGGNRFVLRVRGVEPTHVVRAKRVFDVLAKRGVPNYVGDQRFGYRQNSHHTGRSLLLGDYRAVLDAMLGADVPAESPHITQGREHYRRGEYEEALKVWPKVLRYDRQVLDGLRQGRDARGAVMLLDGAQRAFLVSAWQSAVFNDVLHRRVAGGTFDALLPGDLAWKHDSRATFTVDEETAAIENSPTPLSGGTGVPPIDGRDGHPTNPGGRVERGAVSPSGPLWGVAMQRASGEPGRIEDEALAASGVTEEQLKGPPDDPKATAEGRRRPLRVMLKDPDVEGGVDEHGPYIKASFELPRGAYATVVMREVMKGADDNAAETGD